MAKILSRVCASTMPFPAFSDHSQWKIEEFLTKTLIHVQASFGVMGGLEFLSFHLCFFHLNYYEYIIHLILIFLIPNATSQS